MENKKANAIVEKKSLKAQLKELNSQLLQLDCLIENYSQPTS